MRCLVLGALTCLVSVLALGAQAASQDKPPPTKPASPAEQYQALVKEFQTAEQEFAKAYRGAKTNDERQKVVRDLMPNLHKFPARFLELAQKHVMDPVAVDALIWVVANTPTDDPVIGRHANQARDQLIQNHLTSPKLGALCSMLAQEPLAFSEKLLRGVMEKSPDREVKAQAQLSLAQGLKNLSEQESSPDAKKQADEAEKLLDELVTKYGDIKTERGTLGDVVKPELFELRNLALAKVAPEIEGEDGDGKKFKLSDYRGKVVVLDFWAKW